MYSDAVLDHFRNPHNAGDLLDASATAEVTNPVCGDVLRLAVRVNDGRIAEARFKAQGCVAAIASSSVLTELLAGKSLDEARGITPQQISDALGGFPPATFHAAQLCCDAVASAAPRSSVERRTAGCESRASQAACTAHRLLQRFGIIQIQRRRLPLRWELRRFPARAPTPLGARRLPARPRAIRRYSEARKITGCPRRP